MTLGTKVAIYLGKQFLKDPKQFILIAVIAAGTLFFALSIMVTAAIGGISSFGTTFSSLETESAKVTSAEIARYISIYKQIAQERSVPLKDLAILDAVRERGNKKVTEGSIRSLASDFWYDYEYSCTKTGYVDGVPVSYESTCTERRMYSLSQMMDRYNVTEEKRELAIVLNETFPYLFEVIDGSVPDYVGKGEYIWPAPTLRFITSTFGSRVLNGSKEDHLGVDLAASSAKETLGATVVAAAAGKVTEVLSNSCGENVRILHGNGTSTRYCHLSLVVVKVGDEITQGQAIGLAGNTGNSFGAHLHFEIWKNGVRIDPLPYIAGTKP
ncbi:M23 family metallopeptidase [Streptomyces avermitilis]